MTSPPETSQAGIGARIGLDRFLAWRIPLEVACTFLPAGSKITPVQNNGEAWLLFAAARLDRVRCAGVTLRHRPQVAGWLIPCHIAGNRIGNWFISAHSDDLLTVMAMRALGLAAQRCRIHHARTHLHAVGQASAVIGELMPVPDLDWFTADRCGVIAGWRSILRLPLAKRSWAWQTFAGQLHSPFATRLHGRPVGVIDCSDDLALWGLPTSR